MKRIFVKLLVLSLAVALGSSCIKETFPMSDTATKEQLASSSSALNAMVGAIPAQMATGYLVYGRQTYETDMAWPGIMIALDSVTVSDVHASGEGNKLFSRWLAQSERTDEADAGSKNWFCPDCGAASTGNFCPQCGRKKPESRQ